MRGSQNLIGGLAGLGLCVMGLVWCMRQWRYRVAFDGGEYATAAHIWPENSEAWRQLAENENVTAPADALRAARIAVADDAQDWRNWAALSEMQYFTGDRAGARVSMAAMAARAKAWQAHWRYANLLLLDGDTAGFWTQAETALAQAPAPNLPDLLTQCEAVAQGGSAQLDAALARAQAEATDPAQPALLAEAAVQFSLQLGRPAEAATWWERSLASASGMRDDADRMAGLTGVGRGYLIQLLQAGDAARARTTWQEGVARGIFAPADGPTAEDAVTNGRFAAPFDASPFNWSLCTTCGALITRQTAGEAGLDIEFSGDDIAAATLASEPLLLEPSTTYRLHADLRPRLATQDDTELDAGAGGPAGPSGVAIEIDGATGPVVLLPVAQTDTPVRSAASFTTAAAAGIYRLAIAYTRPPGGLPVRGSLWLTSLSIQPSPSKP